MKLSVIFQTDDGEIYAEVTEVPTFYTLTPHFAHERLRWEMNQPVTLLHMEYHQ